MNCVCGQNYGCKATGDNQDSVLSRYPIDASFVHLPPSLTVRNQEDDTTPLTVENFLEYYDRLRSLGDVALGEDDTLCLECLESVRTSIEQDTKRLENELHSFRESMKDDQLRQESVLRSIRNYCHHDGNASELSDEANVNYNALFQGYTKEIESMKILCKQQVEEIVELNKLRRVQKQLSSDLDDVEWSLEDHQNSLELEARGFDNAEEEIWKEMSETIEELEILSSTDMRLPAVVLDLKVDLERGLRYPLINGLRIAFKSKGDLKWNEIQAAWSLTAQLLLACGTLLQFPSKSWKIVPLSSGAKLIHHNNRHTGSNTTRNQTDSKNHESNDFKVYNLGHPNANGPQYILALNNLMYMIIQHALGVLASEKEMNCIESSKNYAELPFEMTPTSIGGISLVQLHNHDDKGWNRVIHFISCNLLWLSECVSKLILTEVLLETQV